MPFLIRQLLLDILGLAGRGISGGTLTADPELRHRDGGTPAARMQRRIVDAGFVLRERKLALIQSAAHCAGLEIERRLKPIGLDTGFPVSLFGSFSRHVGALGVDERCRPALGHAHALGELFRHTIERVAADKAARERLHQLTGQLVLVRPDAGRKLAAGPRRSEYLLDRLRVNAGKGACHIGLLADGVHRAVVGVRVALLQMVAQHIALRAEQLHHPQFDLRLQRLQARDTRTEINLLQLLVKAACKRLISELVQRHPEVLQLCIPQQPACVCHADALVCGIAGIEDRNFLVQLVQDTFVLPVEPQTQVIVLAFLLFGQLNGSLAPVGAVQLIRCCHRLHRPLAGTGTAAASRLPLAVPFRVVSARSRHRLPTDGLREWFCPR